jgi:predicted dehydrogenase/uncharacterized protein (UPF0303 family)
MIRWGIIGAGNIANRFAKSLKQEENSILYAVSCRTKEKAEAFATKYEAEKAYEGYEALLEDPAVDAVYVALPHNLHKEWVIRALTRHKAVLCEKPAVMNPDEMKEIISCAREHHSLFMEAMKARFTPLGQELPEIIQQAHLGEIRQVTASYCNQMPYELMKGKTYHFSQEAGGALLDGGIYCASYLEYFLKGQPQRKRCIANIRETDFYTNATLQFQNGIGVLECAFDREKEKKAELTFENGTIVIYNLHRPVKMDWIDKQGKVVTIERPYEHDDFYGQIHHFVKLLQEGKEESDVMPMEASLRCAEILEEIRKGYTWQEETLALIEQQEEILRFDAFDQEDAEKIGKLLIRMAQEEYRNPIAVLIHDEKHDSILFQEIMEGKSERNIEFANKKRKAVLSSGHCSIYPNIANRLTGAYQDIIDGIPEQLPVGGSFPVKVKGEIVATISLSGIHEGLDHELLVRGLAAYLGKELPAFHYYLV